MDLYDRKIISWSLRDGMSTDHPSDSEQAKQTTLTAWKMVVINRNIEEVLVFHSDRSVQYASKKFVHVLDF